jgi:fatty acid synthase subunit beta
MLVGKYIPNLIAKPFEVSREYAQLIYDQISSPRLDKVLKKWVQEKWASGEQCQKLAYIILVELLAYQFASPVRWIETQDILFTEFPFERFIELGPSPTLTGMASRTLKAKYEAKDDSVNHSRLILCHAKNPKEIYYQFEDELAPIVEDTPSDTTSPSAPTPPPMPVVAPVVTGAPVSVEDMPIRAVDILSVIVAQKLKKKVDEVSLSKSIKELVGGKVYLAE